LFVLIEPLIWVHENLRGEIPIGFESDGASVPRLPIIYAAWGDKAHREAFFHDFGYRKDSRIYIVDPEKNEKFTGPIPKEFIIASRPITKEENDWWFRLTIKDHKNPEYSWFVYHPMYLAVRICGGSSFHRMNVGDSFELDK
jgi:hypothetical protein